MNEVEKYTLEAKALYYVSSALLEVARAQASKNVEEIYEAEFDLTKAIEILSKLVEEKYA